MQHVESPLDISNRICGLRTKCQNCTDPSVAPLITRFLLKSITWHPVAWEAVGRWKRRGSAFNSWGFPNASTCNIRTWSVWFEILLRFLTWQYPRKSSSSHRKLCRLCHARDTFTMFVKSACQTWHATAQLLKKPRKSSHCSHFVTALSEERLRNSSYPSSEKHANHPEEKSCLLWVLSWAGGRTYENTFL